MATIVGYTAARMKEIEDASIVDGNIVGDELILVRHDGATVNAGNVRGPQGIQGPGGADLTAVMQLLCPTGTVVPFAGAAPPTGWLICDGSSLLRSSYQALFNVVGTTYGNVDGTHFTLPDLRQRMPLGKAASGTGSVLGGKGGSKDSIVVSHSHSHSHGASGSTGAAGTHKHGVGGDKGSRFIITYSPSGWYAGGSGLQPVTATSMDDDGNHTHSVSVSVNADATASGLSGVDANLPPWVAMNYIIRY
jgi:microcystin-dependent protein